MKRKRILSFLTSFILLFGFIAMAPSSKVSAVETESLAGGKLSMASAAFLNPSYATDGIMSTSNYTDSYPAVGRQWVQIDLGASRNINNIKLWHYFGDTRAYHDVIVMISNDSNFAAGSYTIVYNNDKDNSSGLGTGTDNEYSESSAGKNIAFTAANARYVRLYSNGSNVNNCNHYSEIQVFETQEPVAGSLAAGRTPTAPTNFTNMVRITDGDLTANNYSDSYPAAGLQWVQLDLGLLKGYEQNTALALLR